VEAHGFNPEQLIVRNEDALTTQSLPVEPTILVANLPYNISVPVLLHFLEKFPTIRSGVVMVQSEVADRLVAKPGSKNYGSPSVKSTWWADLSGAGNVARQVFWPIPNVDSSLVRFVRHPAAGDEAKRRLTFSVIDAAFAQRRKMLRGALSQLFDGEAEAAIAAAGIDPTVRGETLLLGDFISIARALAK
jgi:16S rRNA (adenine1518-N6/adenine1519-N6)-dimethyltransferase